MGLGNDVIRVVGKPNELRLIFQLSWDGRNDI